MPGNSGGNKGPGKHTQSHRGKDPKGGSGKGKNGGDKEGPDAEGFTTVTRKGKGKGDGRSGAPKSKSAGGHTGTAGDKSRGGHSGTQDKRKEGGQSGTSSADPLSALRRYWRKRGFCLGCGAADHRIKDCPVPTPSTSTAPNAASKTSSANAPGTSKTAKKADSGDSRAYRDYNKKKLSYASAAATGSSSDSRVKPNSDGKDRGAKRTRDSAPTGLTPPAKTARNFSYAKATAGAIEMVALNCEGGHVSKKDFDELEKLVAKLWSDQFEKGEDTVAVDKWTYTTKMATIFVADSRSVKQVVNEADKLGIALRSRAEVEAERRPTVILTGLITGQAAKCERPEIERFLKAEVKRVSIPGRLHYFQAYNTKGDNQLLKIIVDDEAEERLKELDYQLRMGASGLVKFQDERASKKVDQRSRKIRLEQLQTEIERESKGLREKMKLLRDLERTETESVGSMGLGSLNVEDKDKDSSDKYDRLLELFDEEKGKGKGGDEVPEKMQE